jgi:tRNA A37 N6-isopentenylltransferase MiaA
LYEGLDVITNKATKEEMAGIPHHLIGYLDPMCLNYKIMEYKKDAIDLVSH